MAPLSASPDVPGLAARRLSAEILEAVLRKSRPLDEALAAQSAALARHDERDRAFIRRLVVTALRRLGTLRELLARALENGLPPNAPRTESALLLGATQLLWMDVPDHAAVDLSVRLVQANRFEARYARLVNAVLRRVAREGATILPQIDCVLADTPSWLMTRWIETYGEETARAIATANGREPPLDLSVKDNVQDWAARLGGRLLPTGSVRLPTGGLVSALPGFDEGAWWVQDAAAALPAHLLGDVRGRRVADLCAAPGGKTAQLASAGAIVTAVDRSAPRLQRLCENLARLRLDATIVTTDAATWQPDEMFDAILLDAPCLATGTIRRHPDLPWLKQEKDLQQLIGLQTRLLDHAVTLLKPGGALVYCTCSLEPEEGEDAIAHLLARNPQVRHRPITPADVFGLAAFVNKEGDLRTLPCHSPDPDSDTEPALAGLDGFFASRLTRG